MWAWCPGLVSYLWLCSTPWYRSGRRQVVTALSVPHSPPHSSAFIAVVAEGRQTPFSSLSESFSEAAKISSRSLTSRKNLRSILVRLSQQFRSVSGVLSCSFSSQLLPLEGIESPVSNGHCLATYLIHLSGLPLLNQLFDRFNKDFHYDSRYTLIIVLL